MRSLLKLAILFAAILPLLSSCNRDDDYLPSWRCGLQEKSLPDSDTARLFLPNAFTPNGDGLNDVLAPYCVGITNINFTVYDNLGNVLFKTSELGKGWDGLSRASEPYTICHYSVEAVSLSGNRLARCGSVYRMLCVPKGVDRDNLIFGDQFDPGFPEGYLRGISAEELGDCK